MLTLLKLFNLSNLSEKLQLDKSEQKNLIIKLKPFKSINILLFKKIGKESTVNRALGGSTYPG